MPKKLPPDAAQQLNKSLDQLISESKTSKRKPASKTSTKKSAKTIRAPKPKKTAPAPKTKKPTRRGARQSKNSAQAAVNPNILAALSRSHEQLVSMAASMTAARK